jgi:hypothetical protein
VPCLLATASLTCALLGVASVTPAAGGCVGPLLSVRNRLQPGSAAVIVGRNFFSECDDTGSVGGCGVPRDPITGPGNPIDNIQVVITQAGETHLIGRVDADKRFRFVFRTSLPEQLRPGGAVIKAKVRGYPAATRPVVVKKVLPVQPLNR